MEIDQSILEQLEVLNSKRTVPVFVGVAIQMISWYSSFTQPVGTGEHDSLLYLRRELTESESLAVITSFEVIETYLQIERKKFLKESECSLKSMP